MESGDTALCKHPYPEDTERDKPSYLPAGIYKSGLKTMYNVIKQVNSSDISKTGKIVWQRGIFTPSHPVLNSCNKET